MLLASFPMIRNKVAIKSRQILINVNSLPKSELYAGAQWGQILKPRIFVVRPAAPSLGVEENPADYKSSTAQVSPGISANT